MAAVEEAAAVQLQQAQRRGVADWQQLHVRGLAAVRAAAQHQGKRVQQQRQQRNGTIRRK